MWTAIEDMTPGSMEMVLCYGENGYVVRIYHDGDWFNEYGSSTMNALGEPEDITHWQLLPEPPSAGK